MYLPSTLDEAEAGDLGLYLEKHRLNKPLIIFYLWHSNKFCKINSFLLEPILSFSDLKII